MQKLSAGCLLKVLWKGYGVLFCPGDPPQPPLKRGENLLKVPSVLPAGIPPHRSPLKRRENLLKIPSVLPAGIPPHRSPLKRGENLLKIPSVLPAGIPPHRSPLKRRESLLKVPLFKGDLGGSGTLELERWSSELGIFT